MASKCFEVGDLVWAKMKGYPMWPGRIASNPKRKKGHLFVYFFGTYNSAWMLEDKVTAHSDEMLTNSEKYKKMPAELQKAIEEIKCEFTKFTAKSTPIGDSSTDTIDLPLPKNCKSQKKSMTMQKIPSEKNFSLKEVSPRKRSKKSPEEQPVVEEVLSSKNKTAHNDSEISSPKGDDSDSSIEADIKGSSSADHLLHASDKLPCNHGLSKLSVPAVKKPEPQLPSVSRNSVTSTITLRAATARKLAHATKKKIGFIGLGALGQRIVKQLMKKHDLTVWNRTTERCDPFVAAGAKQGTSPYHVVQSCDIIFCCVSEAEAVKSLMFSNSGILKGFAENPNSSKGLVQMTSFDPDSSEGFSSAVTRKGGRYLEAPIIGNQQLAEEGRLVVVSAGDRDLFKDCESCFSAITQYAHYMGPKIGNALKMSIAVTVVSGSTVASIAEAIAVMKRCKLPVMKFLDILKLGHLNSPLLIEKGQNILNNEFDINSALQHQQKIMEFALVLGHQLDQPLVVVAAANEIYKRAMRLQYAKHDSAAVIFGAEP